MLTGRPPDVKGRGVGAGGISSMCGYLCPPLHCTPTGLGLPISYPATTDLTDIDI